MYRLEVQLEKLVMGDGHDSYALAKAKEERPYWTVGAVDLF